MKQKDLLNGYIQHEPFLIEIEPTEGCNLGCHFCGLRGIRKNGTKPWLHLTVENAKIIAEKIAKENWNSRIVFCGHGEPTLNKNLVEIIRVFREVLPKNPFCLITNGAGFKNGNFEIKKFLNEMEELQLNSFIMDVYSGNGDWNVLDGIDREVVVIGHDKVPFNYTKLPMRVALYPMDMDSDHSILRSLSNHCGAAAPLDFNRKNTKCVKPFRELFIRWDGTVALCCDDFRGQYYVENALNDISLKEIWNHPKFQAARIMLYNGKRTIKPCLGCSCPPVRAGLLPDPSAKDKNVMPEVTEEIEKVFKSAYKEEGSTTIIRRKWERK